MMNFRIARVAAVVLGLGLASPLLAGDLNPPAGPVQPTNRVTLNAQSITLPFTIDHPGSYVLTSNLQGVAGQHGLIIAANDVTIDLNGFSVAGAAGSLNGIQGMPGFGNLRVSNGVIRNWADGISAEQIERCAFEDVTSVDNSSRGIVAGSGSSIKDCNCSDNGVNGLFVRNHSIVTGCVFNFNGVTGIQCSANVTIENCVARGNPTNGIRASNNCTVRGCAVERNGTGISADGGSTITDCSSGNNTSIGFALGTGAGGTFINCTAFDNDLRGFSVTSDCLFVNCNATGNTAEGFFSAGRCSYQMCSATLNLSNGFGNSAASRCKYVSCTSSSNSGAGFFGGAQCEFRGCTAASNLNTGILASFDSLVLNNSCDLNSIANIRVTGADTRVQGNSTIDGIRGIEVTSTGCIIISNTSSGASTANFTIAAGNTTGPIINVVGAVIATTNPWANFEY